MIAAASHSPTVIAQKKAEAQVDMAISLLAPLFGSDIFEDRIHQSCSLIGFQPKTTSEDLARLSALEDRMHEARMMRWRQQQG